MCHHHLCSLSSPQEPEQPLFLQLWPDLPEGWKDQDVQLRKDVPALVLAVLLSQEASSLSTKDALCGQEGPVPRTGRTLDGCLEVQGIWLLFMDLIAGKVAVVSAAGQVRAVVLQSTGTYKAGLAVGCSCGVWAFSTVRFLQ